MLKSVFDQQRCRALNFALAIGSFVSLSFFLSLSSPLYAAKIVWICFLLLALMEYNFYGQARYA